MELVLVVLVLVVLVKTVCFDVCLFCKCVLIVQQILMNVMTKKFYILLLDVAERNGMNFVIICLVC